MELDEQTFARIVGSKVNAGSNADDKRAAARVPIGRKAYCAQLQANGTHRERVMCQIREISRKGAGLVTFAQSKEGDVLVVWLTDSEGKEIAFECQIARKEPCVGNSQIFALGVVFIREHKPPAQPSRDAKASQLDYSPMTPEQEAKAIQAIRDAILR